jgi:hypothetical protein
MKHMFTPKQLQDTLTLGEELEKEITEECAKLGAVEKVRRAGAWGWCIT